MTGPERTTMDKHHGWLDLRRSSSPQVTTAPDLALGARGRSVEARIGIAALGRPIRSLSRADRSAAGVRAQTGQVRPDPCKRGQSHTLGIRFYFHAVRAAVPQFFRLYSSSGKHVSASFFIPSSLAFVRFAPRKSACRRSAFLKSAPLKLALRRSAP
jgi:hypothetical protein